MQTTPSKDMDVVMQHFMKTLNKVKEMTLTKKGLVVISLVVPGGIFLASAIVLYKLYKVLEN